MAIIRTKGKKHLLLYGVSGLIGKTIVVKQYKDKIVLANYSGARDKKTSPAQEKQQNRFAEAVAYAQPINNDPVKKAALERKLKGKQRVFQFLLSEYMKGKIKRMSRRKPNSR